MLENLSQQLPFSDQQEQNPSRQLKLPRIDRFPPRWFSKEGKSSTRLPILKSEPLISSIDFETDRQFDDEDVVRQVERRLKIVMVEQNIAEMGESSQSDGDDFEKKIIANKEIIKEAKLKNNKNKKKENDHIYSCNRIGNGNSGSLRKKGTKRSSKFSGQEKKQRESSIENKHIRHPKQIVTAFYRHGMKQCREHLPKSNTLLKQINREIKDDRINSAKEEPLTVLNNRSEAIAPKLEGNRKLKQQLSAKYLAPIHKNQQLFDAIHNYLDNPKRTETETTAPKATKQQLEERLREYEEKLSKNECFGRHKESMKSDVGVERQQIKFIASSQWQRIGMNDKGAQYFDKEVDRIGRYLKRNERSLEKYIENQKLLLDVQMAKRNMGSRQRRQASNKKTSI